MGIEINALKLLLVARARGASFDRTVTLGRQQLFGMLPGEVARILSSMGVPTSTDEAATLMSEESGWCEPLLKRLGAREVYSIDNSSYEGASRVHDMNLPIPDELKGKFSLVFDGGTLEHVFNFPVAIKNAMEMLEVGGCFVGFSPVNNFMGHGLYQFSPEIYHRVFSKENGFTVEMTVLSENFGNAWYEVNDPAGTGHRVQLKNTYPTNILIIARKVEAKVPFAEPPQQSDYVGAWASEVRKVPEGGPRPSNAFTRVLTALRRDVRVFRLAYRVVLPIYALTSPRLRSKLYRRTTAEEMAKGPRAFPPAERRNVAAPTPGTNERRATL